MDGILRERKVVTVSSSIREARAVTVAGKESLDVPRGTLNSILKQAGLKQREVER